MNKILLIIRREYLTRVRNRTFLLSTFLLPLVMVAFIGGSVFFSVSGKQQLRLAVVNDPGYYASNVITDSSRLILDFLSKADSSNYVSLGYDGVLYLPSDTVSDHFKLYSAKQIGIESTDYIIQRLNKALETHLLQEKGILKNMLDSISNASEDAVQLSNIVREKNGESKKANAELAYGIGFGSGLLIYITIFIFGSMVMRGVMEEKMNRIAEVIISSVKPFQLMIGKIIGIAGVGLTQFLLWTALLFVLANAAVEFLPAEIIEQAKQLNAQKATIATDNTALLKIMEVNATLSQVNWWLIISCFLFYFLGGYLFYSALFAAVGSVINEDPQEAQSLMLPITMPIIFSFIILSSGLQNTNSPMMFWGSMIPFTSPIVMMGRLPSGVPWQELALSMALMVAGFLFTTWMAGKIYRTGILLYGKKASWKEMIKWAFRKN